MQGIFLNSPLPVRGVLVSPTDYSDLGSSHVLARRRWESSYTNFEMTFDGQHKSEAEAIRYLMKNIKGDVPVWFDGGEFNDLLEFQEIGKGNGVQTQFQLLDRNVFGASLVITINDVLAVGWTVVEAPGVVVFATAVPDKAVIRAKYKFRSKCLLVYEESSMLSQTDQFKSFSTEKVAFREIP